MNTTTLTSRELNHDVSKAKKAEIRKALVGKADARVVDWVRKGAAPERFFISVVTVLELERGVLGIQRRDAVQGARLRTWLDDRARPEFAGRILPVDDKIATRCAHLHVADRRDESDALIAATALVHDMPLVTRNVRDFDGTGVVTINPWQVS